MTSQKRISTPDIVEGSYAYLRAATGPALIGTLIYAVISGLGDFSSTHEVFGSQSSTVSGTVFAVMAIAWLAMSLRHGLGQPRKGIFGLTLGMDEIRLAASILGFVFVMGIVVSLLGFGVFLLLMIVAAAGAGALEGEDVVGAELFTSLEAFNEFLVSGGAGTFVAITGVAIIVGAFLFFIWMTIRLLPFAAATIDQGRFVVLQAMSWTRYQDVALTVGAILTMGVGAAFIFAARYTISIIPLPDLLGAFLMHVASCFGALLFVGFICTVYTILVVQSDRENAL
ncbi:MAG: hypothetical protein AAF583_05800 [Pseudomonadota bacterium]